MKVAVIYSSMTGNTEKLARGIFDKIQGHEKDLFNLKDKPDISGYDIVACGFWIDRSTANKEMGEFISGIRDKKVFLFGTMGHLPDSDHGEKSMANVVGLVDDSCKIIGYFMACGKINMRVLEGIKHMKAETIGEKAFKAHMLDEKNLIVYKILGDHVNDADIDYCSARLNERIYIEECLAKL